MTDQTGQPDTAGPERSFGRRILKWGLIALATLLALVLVLLLALRFAAQSGFGRNFVEARIEAADPSGQDIEVEGLSGDLLGTFRIERLTVADEQGIWLVAENVLADWKPFALRNRALRVDALEADLIHVIRRPVLVPSDRPKTEGGSMPLRAGEIDKLRIGELRTDEGVLPRALSLTIDGQGEVGRNGGRTQLSVLPLDGKGDTLEADLTWSDDFRVKGNLSLDGPAGGLFASLARLDDGQSLSASLDASGALQDWSADSDILINGQSAVTLDAAARGDLISFESEIHPGLHPLTASLAETLGPTLTIEGDVSREDRAPVLDVTAQAEGLLLSAVARKAETEEGGYQADFRLEADNPTRYAGLDTLSLDQAILDGMLVYSGGTARFDGTVEVSGVDVPSFKASKVSGPVVATYGEKTVTARATLSADGAVLPGMAGRVAGARPVLETDATYDVAGRTLTLRQTSVQGRAGRVSAVGTVSLGDALGADLSGSFDLDGAKAGLARPIKASGNFEADRGRTGLTDISARINATRLGDLPAPLSDWASDQALIDLAGTLQPDTSFTLKRFSAESGSLVLTGNGQVSQDRVVSASADLRAGEAGLAGYRLSGLTGQAAVSGPVDNLDFRLAIEAPQISNETLVFNDIRLGADGTYGSGALAANATLNAGTSEGPLDLNTALRLDGADWQVNGLEASWGDLTADADLSGSGGDLAALRGTANVRGDLPDGLPAQGIDLNANIQGEALTLDATFETIAIGPTRADALVIRATGTPDNADFLIDMDGRTELNDLSYETALDIDGHVTGLAGGAPDVTATLSALLGDVGLSTEEPLRYITYEDGFDLDARFAALGGTFTPAITTRGTTRIDVGASELEIAPLLILLGRPALDGALDLDLIFTETDDGGLSGPLKASMENLARPGSDLAPIDLFIDGELSPERLDLTLRALDNESLQANATAEVPVKTSAGLPFIQLQKGAVIPFSANADGQIEAIAALFVPPQMVLKGDVDLALSGELPSLNESFKGTLQFSDGVFEHGDLGMVLNRISADATLGSGTVTLSSFDARGRSGGTLNGSGSMAIDGSGRSDVAIRANRLVVTERREGSATVSGTLSLNQKPELLEITGDLTVDEGEINLDNLPEGGPPTLDVSFRQPEQEEEEEPRRASTNLDIQLNAPGRIDIRGRGVNAELGLDADIQGPIGSPEITGSAEIVRGRFDLLGKRFEFTDSTIRLAPELGDSRLSVSARHETRDDITAILNVTGTISRPEIALTSEPVLPEDEVLSRVLFGRSPTQLTALETARLAAALAQLSGGGGFDLLGGIETALGLDTFDVGSGAGGGVEVTSGKYLTEDVYLEVRSGAAGAPGLAIEWEPIENIEVEAATNTGEDQGQELSIQWKKDFD